MIVVLVISVPFFLLLLNFSSFKIVKLLPSMKIKVNIKYLYISFIVQFNKRLSIYFLMVMIRNYLVRESAVFHYGSILILE